MSSLDSNRPWGAGVRSPERDAELGRNVDECWRFFMGDAAVQKATEKLVGILESEQLTSTW